MKRPENLEAFRYQMLIRGYMNKTELAKFMDCGYNIADKAYKAMMKDAEAEGLEKLNDGHILTKRVVAFLGLTEKKIIDAYERKEKDASPIKTDAQRTQPHSTTNVASV